RIFPFRFLPAGDQLQRLLDTDMRWQRRILQLDAGTSGKLDLTAIGLTQAFDAFQQRRLSRAIDADHAEYLALTHRKADLVQSKMRAIPLAQAADLHHVFHALSSWKGSMPIARKYS